MSLKDLIKEHKTLVPVLAKGTPAQRKKEAQKQMKELKGYITRRR